MSKLEIAKESAKLVDKNLTPTWILWTYVDAYQQEGVEFRGAH